MNKNAKLTKTANELKKVVKKLKAKSEKKAIKESFDQAVNRILTEAMRQGDIYNPNDKAEYYEKVQSTLSHLGMDGQVVSQQEFDAQLKNKPFQSVVDFVKNKKQRGLKPVQAPAQSPTPPVKTPNQVNPQEKPAQTTI